MIRAFCCDCHIAQPERGLDRRMFPRMTRCGEPPVSGILIQLRVGALMLVSNSLFDIGFLILSDRSVLRSLFRSNGGERRDDPQSASSSEPCTESAIPPVVPLSARQDLWL